MSKWGGGGTNVVSSKTGSRTFWWLLREQIKFVDLVGSLSKLGPGLECWWSEFDEPTPI